MKRKRRLSVRKIKEISRLYLKLGFSIQAIAGSCKISTSTAHTYVNKLKKLNLSYEEIINMNEGKLHNLFFPENKKKAANRPVPDFEYLATEMKKKGVTLQLLYEEYIDENPSGYSKSWFYEMYRKHVKRLQPTMRFNHKAAEKMFEDFSGDKLSYTDPTTGKQIEVELFVSVLGASSYIFAYVVANQNIENFTECNVKAFEYYAGVPECIVIDNLKAGVTSACYYDPDINRTFADLAEHYNTAVLPARPYKAKDKAKVENAVLQAQRRIIAVLRNMTFFSLWELREAVREATEKLNKRPMTLTGKSRYELYMEIERSQLKPLPQDRFTIYKWKKGKIHIDYHLQVEKSYYSVPYTLIGQQVEARYNNKIVEIFHEDKGIRKRAASHKRSHRKGEFVTDKLHMPHEHRQYLEWTPQRMKQWGRKIGENTKILMEKMIESKKVPEYAFRGCLGVIRLSRMYSPQRVENACRRALSVNSYNYRSVKSILQKGLDKLNYNKMEEFKIIQHDNIRGKEYYREATNDAVNNG